MNHTSCQFRDKHTVGGIVFYKHAFLVILQYNMFHILENFRGYSNNRGRSRGGRGRGDSRGGSPSPMSRLDSDGDLMMGDEEPQPTRKRL